MKADHVGLRIAGLMARMSVIVVTLFALSSSPGVSERLLVIAVLLMIVSLAIDEVRRRLSRKSPKEPPLPAREDDGQAMHESG
jgi:hypothetical protein